jgi:hypothetical protein
MDRMKFMCPILLVAFSTVGAMASDVPLSPALRLKVEAKLKEMTHWGTDPKVVEAVKAYNAAPSADAKAMTNEKWKTLGALDPFVLSYTNNPLAVHLKAKRDESIAEEFVSGADGNKVAFLAKPTYWCHKDKDKHRVPMTGKTWVGSAEIDESSGQLQIQVAFPVLDGTKPIGSVVVGLAVTKLK